MEGGDAETGFELGSVSDACGGIPTPERAVDTSRF